MRNTGLEEAQAEMKIARKNINNLMQANNTTLMAEMEKAMATHSSILTWEKPMDRGAWQMNVHRVTKSWTQLSN